MEFIAICIVSVIVIVAIFVKMPGSGKTPAAPAVKDDAFSRTALLNKSETAVLAALDACVRDVFGPDARIFSQVSYGEFLKGETRGAHAKINQKRADFLIASPAETVVCVVEYQGAGHYGRSQASREKAQVSDSVKRSALSSAGIPLVEVPAKFSRDSVRNQMIRLNPYPGASKPLSGISL